MVVRATFGVAVIVAVLAVLAAQGPPPTKGSSYFVEPRGGAKRRNTPLLFVHGTAHGGWVFRAVAEKLAAEGWTVHCITLAKHRFKTLEEYTDEIVEYVEYNIGRGPVVLGHSLGGMLVSHFLLNDNPDIAEEKRAKGAVFAGTYAAHDLDTIMRTTQSTLNASLVGSLWGALRFNLRHVLGIDANTTKQLLFAPGTTSTNIAGDGQEDLDSYLNRLDNVESGIVMFDLIKTVATTPHKSSPSALNIPTLAVIPGEDRLIAEWTQLEHAAFWNATVLKIPGQGHMLGDPGWEEAYAKPLAAWLAQTFS